MDISEIAQAALGVDGYFWNSGGVKGMKNAFLRPLTKIFTFAYGQGRAGCKISVFYASPKWHMHPGIPVLSTICCCILVWQLYDSFSNEILRAKYFIEEISRYKLRKLQKMKIMDNFVGWETSLCKKYVVQKHTQKCSDSGNLSIEDGKRRFFIVSTAGALVVVTV